MRSRLGRLSLGTRRRPRARPLRPVAFGLAAAAAVFTGMGLGSLFGDEVVPGRGSPNAGLLPLSVVPATRLVPGSALPGIAVPPDQVAQLVDASLDWSREVTAPGADPETTAPECLLADPVGARAAYGEDWTAFRRTTAQPAEDDDSTQVVLAVGLYPSESKARGLFAALVAALRACDGKSATETTALSAESSLTFHIGPAGPDSVRWRAERRGAGQDAPVERRCSYDARTRRNALFEVMVCASGPADPDAAPVAQALAAALPS